MFRNMRVTEKFKWGFLVIAFPTILSAVKKKIKKKSAIYVKKAYKK